MTQEPDRQICNYEGSAYRSEFWGEGRDYEDAAERVALSRMLPSTGKRLIDIGGGYGRLVPLYEGYRQVVIFDYALSQLREAQELWGSSGPNATPQYTYVAGDYYHLPFTQASFDTVVLVRALHHAADAPAVLHGASRLLAPGGSFVLEFANKRNLKAVVRYLIGRQDWSPFSPEPVEFAPLNFDFHPAWIAEILTREGLRIRETRAVSSLRLGLFKRLLPLRLLLTLDRLCQPSGELLPLSPSIFVRSEAVTTAPPPLEDTAFQCPACRSAPLRETNDPLSCPHCGASFPIDNGIHNFKASDTEPGRAPSANDQRSTSPLSPGNP
ncbi:MAG: methyltransferase domain-containing protein [Anaerolineae bacterium]|jgi:SAM-dependent methyltransferase